MNCSRCDVEMTLGPFYAGSSKEAWFCPCCKSSLRTAEMLQAEWEAEAERLGMTWAEYEAHMDEQVRLYVRKPAEADMARAVEVAEMLEREWTPACEHDTNPGAAA